MPAKIYLPKSSDEVYKVMKDYSSKKKFNFSDTRLQYMAEDCYLYFSSRGWAGVKYWPSVAMRWVLTNAMRDSDYRSEVLTTKEINKEPTIRNKILKKQQDFEEEEPDIHGDSYGDR